MGMFEEQTYENILDDLLAMAPPGVDTRQGSIYYDAVAPCAMKLAAFYVDAKIIVDLVSVTTATGSYLDEKGKEYGVTRNPATSAKYQFVYEGTRPEAGTRFFADNLYFYLEDNDGALYLVSEVGGETANSIIEGTRATPVNTVEGLTRAEFGPLVEPGQDTESDDDYRGRIQDKIGGPAQNGNKYHYKSWCEEVAGVGRARILPLWNGENTVKGVLLDPDGNPVSVTVVDRVQEYVDPGGTGLGEGKANIGAHFTAAAAVPIAITINCTVTLAVGYSLDGVREAALASVQSYLKGLALNTSDEEEMVVRISSIGAMIYALAGVVDYSDLTVNGDTANISVPKDHVAVLEEVVISGSV